MGLFIGSVGYFVAGTPGGIAGGAAMVTPCIADCSTRVFGGPTTRKSPQQKNFATVVIAGAGLLLAAVISPARDALTASPTIAIAEATVLVMLVSELTRSGLFLVLR
jgi:chromate transporter